MRKNLKLFLRLAVGTFACAVLMLLSIVRGARNSHARGQAEIPGWQIGGKQIIPSCGCTGSE